MNYFDMIKQINAQRQQEREKRELAYKQSQSPASEDIFPILSDKQKKAINDQNLLLKHAAELMGIQTFAVSRDKSGHPLILTLRSLEGKNTPELYCYTLGLNTETNKLYAFCVGKNSFRFTKGFGFAYPEPSMPSPNNLHINVLATHPAFDGLGIGRILMQATENLAILNGMQTMSLNQELSFVKKDKSATPTEKTQSYIAENFFDKNMYFYYTQGFELETSTQTSITTDLRPLKKEKLKQITLDYGFAKPLVKVDKDSPKFKVKNTVSGVDTVKTFGYTNFFPMFLNNISGDSFSPISLKPNDSYTKYLHALLCTKKAKEVFTPTSVNKRDFMLRTIKERNIEESFHFNTTCSQESFIQQVVQQYEDLIDIRNQTSKKPKYDLYELLQILEDKYNPDQFRHEEDEPNW